MGCGRVELFAVLFCSSLFVVQGLRYLVRRFSGHRQPVLLSFVVYLSSIQGGVTRDISMRCLAAVIDFGCSIGTECQVERNGSFFCCYGKISEVCLVLGGNKSGLYRAK